MDENRVREIVREEQAKTPRALPYPLDINTLFALKTGGFVLFGTAVLDTGVATVTDHRIRASSIVIACYTAPNGTMGANLKAVCAQGSLTITAVKSDKSTETSDTSTVAYIVIL